MVDDARTQVILCLHTLGRQDSRSRIDAHKQWIPVSVGEFDTPQHSNRLGRVRENDIRRETIAVSEVSKLNGRGVQDRIVAVLAPVQGGPCIGENLVLGGIIEVQSISGWAVDHQRIASQITNHRRHRDIDDVVSEATTVGPTPRYGPGGKAR